MTRIPFFFTVTTTTTLKLQLFNKGTPPTCHSLSSQSMSSMGSSQGPVSCVGPTHGWPAQLVGESKQKVESWVISFSERWLMIWLAFFLWDQLICIYAYIYIYSQHLKQKELGNIYFYWILQPFPVPFRWNHGGSLENHQFEPHDVHEGLKWRGFKVAMFSSLEITLGKLT